MVHRRSMPNLLKREAKRYIITASFRDREKSETVCRCTFDDVMDHLRTVYEGITTAGVPRVEKGLVLSDSRGNGAFQT